MPLNELILPKSPSTKATERKVAKELADKEKPAYLRGKSSVNAQPAEAAGLFNADAMGVRPTQGMGRGITNIPNEIAQVSYVHDGDTVILEDGRKVRLLGMNAPEVKKGDTPAEEGGYKSRDALRELFKDNKNISLVFGKGQKDKYGRTLAHVLTEDGKNVQQILLAQGNAKALSIAPNTRLEDFYASVEAAAEQDDVNKWKKSIEAVPEDYVPAYLRSSAYSTDAPTAPTPILENAASLIVDDGLLTWGTRALRDLIREDASAEDEHEILANVDGMIEKAGIHPSTKTQILEQAQSVEHAQELVDHILDQQRKAPGREAMSFMGSATSGVLGFIGDPANLIPGTLMLKAGSALTKAFPKIAAKVATAAPTLSGKASRWAAFGAVEEAIRSAPRLAADPTFHQEDYLLNVGFGALFGVGLARGIPGAKWLANNTITPAFKALNGALDGAYRAAQESASIRFAGNVVAAAARGSKKVASNPNVKATIKEMDTGSTIRNARNKAREQAAKSKVLNRLKDTAVKLAHKLNRKDVDLADPAIKSDLHTAMRDAIRVGSGEEKAVQAFDAKIAAQEAATVAKATAKTTDGAAKEVKPQTFADTIREVEKLRTTALETLQHVDPKKQKPLIAAIEANSLQAIRALEAAAARQGVKVVRRTVKRSEVIDTMSARINKLIPDRVDKEFGKIANKLNFIQPNMGMQAGFKNVIRQLGIKAEGVNARQAVIDHILANPKKVQQRATTFRENITSEFNRMSEDMSLKYTGHPNDKDFLRAKELLRQTQEELEFTMDWAAMNWQRQASDLNKLDPRWALLSDEYEQSITPEVRKQIHEMYDSFSQRLVKNQFGRLTRSLGSDLISTKVPLAEWQAMNIFELAPGLGGLIDRPATAVIRAEMHMSEILTPALVDYNDLMDEAGKALGKGILGTGLLKRLNPHSGGDVQMINRMVMREMSARQMGKNIDSPSYIREYTDKLTATNEKLYNIQAQHGIEGITNANKMNHYMRQSWHDGAILNMIDNTNVGRSGLVELFSKSMLSRSKGALSQKDAQTFAEALIDLKLEAMNKPTIDNFALRSDNLTGTMSNLEDVFKRMSDNNKGRDIENVLKWVKEDLGGKPGYVNKRHVNLDYETTITKNGQTVSILDLLDNDVIGQVNRYAKEASGRAALAESSGGRLTSEQSINDLLAATAQQANDMGTHVNIKDLRNAYRQMLGLPYDGQLPMDWRKTRDAVSLAGMNGLGESQLAELGLSINRGLAGMFAMNQLASKTVGRIKQWRHIELSDSQKQSKALLDELQEHSKLYEDMHILQRQNVHFDAREGLAETSLLQKIVDTGTGGKYRPYMQYLQTRYTGYASVRTMEEQLSMASLMQDAVKIARTGKGFTSEARMKDLGLDTKIISKYLKDKTITVDSNGKLQTLNMHRWSKADQNAIGVSLQRHAGQTVQRAFVGEVSPLAANPTVAFMMQFKSYPLLAAEKQMGRNMMFADKEAAMGITLNAASSAAARAIRYYSLALALPENKRERYLEQKFSNDFGHDTAMYMGIVGMMVNNYDMAQDLVFGNEGNVGDQLPVISWANNALQATKIADPTGEVDERDMANIQRGAPLGTIMYTNMIMGVIRTMMDTDTDNTYENNRNRGN